MTDKELRRLSRRELLQMLLEQTSEVERLQAELDKTRAELDDLDAKAAAKAAKKA